MSTVKTGFVADVADALEYFAAQAQDATGQTVADHQIGLLVRHLRGIARMSGPEVADWRFVLLRNALGPGVKLSTGTIGHQLRRLAVTPDSRDMSIDRLINGLVVLAVQERIRVDGERIQAAEHEGRALTHSERRVAGQAAELEQRTGQLEAELQRLRAHRGQVQAELADERRRVEFLRGFVPEDIAAESEGKPKVASDAKQRVDTGIYARERADGGVSYQVVGTKTRPGKTFDDLQAAVAYRDGRAPAGSEPEPRAPAGAGQVPA